MAFKQVNCCGDCPLYDVEWGCQHPEPGKLNYWEVHRKTLPKNCPLRISNLVLYVDCKLQKA